MTATQDLIAAALSLADIDEHVAEMPTTAAATVREMCARAMVRPDVVEVERLVNELNHAAYRSGHAAASRAEPRGTDTQRIALLDYVRGVMAERDALCAVHAGATKKMARDERQLFESWIVRECGPGETKRWLNTEAYENMRVNDYRTGWAACLGLMSAASNPVSAAEVPMPEPSLLSPETIDGYQHVYPMWNELTMHAYGDAREAAGYAAGVAAVRDYAVMRWCAEVSNRPLVNTHRRTLDDTWRQVIRHTGGDPETLIGPCHDVLVALRGEVKP